MSITSNPRPRPLGYTHAAVQVADPEFGQAWRNEETGDTYANIRLGPHSDVTFYSADAARQVAEAALKAAEALDRLAAETENAEVA